MENEHSKIEISTMIFTSFNILFLIISLCFYHEDHSILEKYKNNWNSNSTIKIISVENNTCPQNYSPLISSKIDEHYYPYCNCSGVDKYNNSTFKNTCNEEQKRFGCKSYEKFKEINLTNYRGKTLCTLRDNENYDAIMYYMKINKTYNKSISTIDKLGNTYNVKSYNYDLDYFPIVDLQITNNRTKLNEYVNYTKIELNDGYYLLYTKNISNKSIVVDAIVTLNEKVCAHPNEGIFLQKNYDLNYNKGESTCKTKISNIEFDENYNEIDRYSVKQFLTDNHINESLQDYLNITNGDIHLQIISYYGVSLECYKNLNTTTFFKVNVNFLTIRIAVTMMIIWYVIFIIIIYKQIKRVIDDIVGFLFINIVLQLLIGLFAYSSVARFIYYLNGCVTGVIHEWMKYCFKYINIAIYSYIIGFFLNFVNMFIVYCLENPDIDLEGSVLMDNSISSKSAGE